MAWLDIPESVRLGILIDPHPASFAITIQNLIANIYNVPIGKALLDNYVSSANPINVVRADGILADVATRTAFISTSMLESGGLGFLNTDGYFVPFTPERLLFHELVHAAQGLDDGNWLIGTTTTSIPNWELLYEPVLEMMGPTVIQENIFAQQHQGASAGLIERPA